MVELKLKHVFTHINNDEWMKKSFFVRTNLNVFRLLNTENDDFKKIYIFAFKQLSYEWWNFGLLSCDGISINLLGEYVQIYVHYLYPDILNTDFSFNFRLFKKWKIRIRLTYL